jgi:hypothetical protein
MTDGSTATLTANEYRAADAVDANGVTGKAMAVPTAADKNPNVRFAVVVGALILSSTFVRGCTKICRELEYG